MSWPIRLFESRQAARNEFGFVPVGAMWPASLEDAKTLDEWCEWFAPFVGRRYLRENKASRLPLFVKLPDGSEFCIDFCSSREGAAGGGEGWGCSGAPPRITLSPSINIIGYYHGWIRDGVIIDDCEGRTFPNARGFPPAAS